mmetsp:Transcript_15221/g.19283  ORF Transcript_15221/g.19283 Transcript_15221/m.19283 type:complete len:131 (+) Transcript_15221:4685-5077(+)
MARTAVADGRGVPIVEGSAARCDIGQLDHLALVLLILLNLGVDGGEGLAELVARLRNAHIAPDALITIHAVGLPGQANFLSVVQRSVPARVRVQRHVEFLAISIDLASFSEWVHMNARDRMRLVACDAAP